MATLLRRPRPGRTWTWWAVDAAGFLVQFGYGPAPAGLSAHLDRVDAAADWAEEHRPAWFGPDPLPLHASESTAEMAWYTRQDSPAAPLRLPEAPAVIAEVAALVALNRAVGDTRTIHLDEGWV
ncbi:hypothetical protein SLA_4447 [Streptomyces laurentii]|uniref:Uncharacterized protein n=1 Tax=Streptomyces laurentii TaxID=39478 RepID=A0A160P3F7_STRLU|nr:hypothetical protein SLA_4447 [Streptomyces laurentii]